MRVRKTEYRNGSFHSVRDQFTAKESPIWFLFRDPAITKVTLTRHLDGAGGPMVEEITYELLSRGSV